MDCQTKLEFNTILPSIMHIDLNSCFASIEQQANPLLRGKPIVVAAYVTSGGCILASSIEAKTYGIKTGMRVGDGKVLYPNLIVLSADPEKYRFVHLKLKKLLSNYTDNLTPKSIDEFVLDFRLPLRQLADRNDHLVKIAKEIKLRIKNEIGEWLRVSIGISTNRSLAKLASNLKKPDGLEIIDKKNYLEVYQKVKLTDLHGINIRNAARLNSVGIYNVLEFYNAPLIQLRSAFKSINSYYWFLRLHGYEVGEVEFSRKSFGNSYALSKPFSMADDLSPIMAKLTTKMASRLRASNLTAHGIHLSLIYRNGEIWHKGKTFPQSFFDTRDFYKELYKLLLKSGCKYPVRILAVSCFNLKSSKEKQLDLFSDILKKESLVNSIDNINKNYGDFTISSARISFGK